MDALGGGSAKSVQRTLCFRKSICHLGAFAIKLPNSLRLCPEANSGTTLEYPAAQNVYPVFADTGYGSCILSWILFIDQAETSS